MHVRWGALAIVIATLGWSATARAQAQLAVRTLEHGEWASAVAALQADRGAEGRPVHVVVEDAQGRAACGGYLLLLDGPGQLAFRTGRCDPYTQATELWLVNRTALFELGDAIARPRLVQIAAFQVRSALAQGRAVPPASAELHCTVTLRPFVVDLLSGARVQATPALFELRALGDGARVSASGDGWTVRSASLRFDYDLVDRRSGQVVLRESVSLSCSSEASPARAARAAVPEPAVARAEQARAEQASAPPMPIEGTLSAGESRYRGRCGGERAPEHVYAIHIGDPIWVALRVESRFDAVLSLRNAAGDELDCSVVTGARGEVRVPRAWAQLAPGTYYVVVDAAGPDLGDGWYRLGMDFLRLR